MANKAAGKGYENENFYENIKFYFLGIENIHVMRAGLSKLLESKSLCICVYMCANFDMYSSSNNFFKFCSM